MFLISSSIFLFIIASVCKIYSLHGTYLFTEWGIDILSHTPQYQSFSANLFKYFISFSFLFCNIFQMKMVNRIYEERFQMKEINNFVSTNEKIKKLRYVSLQKFKIVPCLLRALKKPKFNFPISLEKSLSRNIVFHL